MQIIISILILTLCILIFIQDLKTRVVIWVFFPILFVLLLGLSLMQFSVKDVFINKILFNTLLLIITASGMVLYFSLKGKSFKTVKSEMIGLGDVLFLLAITPFFDPFSFCFFIVFGSLISIIGNLVFDYFNKEKSPNIPFAGNLALILSIMIFLIEFNFLPDINNNIYPFFEPWNLLIIKTLS